MKKEKLTVASKAAEEVIKTPRASTTREAEKHPVEWKEPSSLDGSHCMVSSIFFASSKSLSVTPFAA